jgi:hypothetical protein
MPQFLATFGMWFGALLAVFLFLAGCTFLALWVLSHLAPPDKK